MSNTDLKVVLLGSEFVGKTSLAERFVHNRFSCRNYQNTIGAAYSGRRVTSNNVELVMGIWDTAGSERYESMSRVYYRGAKAAIICYDVQSKPSWERAKFWVKEVRSVEEDCKIYICATKIDTVDDETPSAVDRQTALSYANGMLYGYMETSSKSGDNVCELFQRIADDWTANPKNLQQLRDTIKITKIPPAKSCSCN